MKKATMNAIIATLNAIDFENKDAIMAELNAEVNRGVEAKAAKTAEYDAVKDVILGALTETPATIAEIFDAVKDELPQGFTRNKVQYAITRLWADEVAKFEGKPNTYAIKA